MKTFVLFTRELSYRWSPASAHPTHGCDGVRLDVREDRDRVVRRRRRHRFRAQHAHPPVAERVLSVVSLGRPRVVVARCPSRHSPPFLISSTASCRPRPTRRGAGVWFLGRRVPSARASVDAVAGIRSRRSSTVRTTSSIDSRTTKDVSSAPSSPRRAWNSSARGVTRESGRSIHHACAR